jgi:hypothetical protein
MKSRSIHAYDLPSRVDAYDLELGIMHPNRGKTIRCAEPENRRNRRR